MSKPDWESRHVQACLQASSGEQETVAFWMSTEANSSRPYGYATKRAFMQTNVNRGVHVPGSLASAAGPVIFSGRDPQEIAAQGTHKVGPRCCSLGFHSPSCLASV